MTYYAVTGENEGFAILWTMIVPSAVMFLGGVKLGISLSLYYWCLFVVLFYTPFRSCVAGQYTETFMNRYPVIYMCAIMINSAAMIRYHISVLNDMEYNERLTNEVQRLTAIEIERRQQMERMSLQMIETLANAIDAKDKYTNGHSYRVSEYAVLLAKKLGWDEKAIEIMGEAIKWTISKNQVWMRCSKSQIMLLLTEDVDQIDRIVQNIYVNFYKLTDGTAFELSYEVVL